MDSLLEFDPAKWTQDQLARVKIVKIDPMTLINFLYGQKHAPMCVSIPNLVLPDGYVILSVHVDWEPRTLEMMISHPSFDVVPVGSVPPCVHADISWTMYALATEDEVKSRPTRNLGGVLDIRPAKPIKTWREQPPLL